MHKELRSVFVCHGGGVHYKALRATLLMSLRHSPRQAASVSAASSIQGSTLTKRASATTHRRPLDVCAACWDYRSSARPATSSRREYEYEKKRLQSNVFSLTALSVPAGEPVGTEAEVLLTPMYILWTADGRVTVAMVRANVCVAHRGGHESAVAPGSTSCWLAYLCKSAQS